MNRKTRSSYARVFVIAASFVSCAGAVEFVTGRVVDMGLSEPKNGIAGVTVVISESTTQKSVGNPGITDGKGAYNIEINTPHTTKLVAKFSKIGYFARPKYQPVASLTRAQPSVELAKESAPDAYYKAVADNIWIVYSADPNAATASFSAVTSLGATEKAVVFNALKLKEGDAYKSLKVADETYQATQTFLSNYEPIDFSAYANYGSTGTVWLFGAVPDLDIKSSVEREIKRSTAVQNVQNDLAISK